LGKSDGSADDEEEQREDTHCSFAAGKTKDRGVEYQYRESKKNSRYINKIVTSDTVFVEDEVIRGV